MKKTIITGYKIISTYSTTDLTKKVEKEVENAWTPFGSMVIETIMAEGASVSQFHQSMVFEEEIEG